MKKFFLYCAAFVLGIIALGTLIPMAGLLVSGIVLAAGVHFYRESESAFGKIVSATVALAGLLSAVSNFPAFVGLLAIAAVYFMFKDNKIDNSVKSDDPFTNFEKEWAKLQK